MFALAILVAVHLTQNAYSTNLVKHSPSVNPKLVDFHHCTVALTHDHHPFKKGRYFYASSFGLLTIMINNTVHKVAKIGGNRHELGSLTCGRLGYAIGHLIDGPWLKLHDSAFSRLTSMCEDNDNVSLSGCVRVEITNITTGYVDYILCANKEDKVFETM